jgi:hypothetical protein
MAVMTCNTSGQTVRQKDRVISGNANLSKLDTEGTGAVKDDKLPETTDTGFFTRKGEIRILKRKKYQKKITSG